MLQTCGRRIARTLIRLISPSGVHCSRWCTTSKDLTQLTNWNEQLSRRGTSSARRFSTCHELLPIAIWSNMTRIRQVAPLLHIINFNNLCFRVENETTLISAKNRVDLSSISEVRSYITEWPLFWATLYIGSSIGFRNRCECCVWKWRCNRFLAMILSSLCSLWCIYDDPHRDDDRLPCCIVTSPRCLMTSSVTMSCDLGNTIISSSNKLLPSAACRAFSTAQR